MDFVFLAHGAQVMIGAYAAAAITQATGNFLSGLGWQFQSHLPAAIFLNC